VIGEFDIAGVFIPAPAVWGTVAIIVNIFLRRLLTIVGFYRLVWHRGLFDLAMIVILWGSITAFASNYGGDAMHFH
jgi:hypothetical protein